MFYSIILKNLSIVADYSEEDGDFQEVLLGVLKANRSSTEFYEINYLQYNFYFMHKDEFTFACISNLNVDQEKIHLFLNSLKVKFFEVYIGERDHFTLKVTNLIKDLMSKYKDSMISMDKFEIIQEELKEVENQKLNILKQTFEKEMALDTLISKSDNLKRNSINLKYQIKNTLHKVKKTNNKYYLVGLFAIMILLGFYSFKIVEYSKDFLLKITN